MDDIPKTGTLVARHNFKIGLTILMRTELVTTLKRQATEILNQLDVETFENLQRRMTLLEGIARGERAIEEGRSLTHKRAKRRMSRWLK